VARLYVTAQFIIGHEGWIAKVTEEDSRLLSEDFWETRNGLSPWAFGGILGILIEICATHLKGLL